MRVDKLEMYIDKQVEVTTCFDDKQLRGVLKKTGAEEFKNNLSLYYKTGIF